MCLFPLDSQRLQRIFSVYTKHHWCLVAVDEKHWSPTIALMQPSSMHWGRFPYYLQILFFDVFTCLKISNVFCLSAWFLNLVVLTVWFSFVELSFQTSIFSFSKGFLVKRNCVKAQLWIFWFVLSILWKIYFEKENM